MYGSDTNWKLHGGKIKYDCALKPSIINVIMIDGIQFLDMVENKSMGVFKNTMCS